MLVRGPIWHSALGALCLVSGCYAMHGAPADAGQDVRPLRDARSVDVRFSEDVRFPEDTVLPGPCAFYFDQLRAGTPAAEIGCDGRTFPSDCVTEVGACCWLSLSCAGRPADGGNVVASLSCLDSCDQSCGGQTLEDCALFPYCERFDPRACGPAPAGIIEGPACIQARSGACASDADCEAGLRCRSYWVNPCAGLMCDACGAEERRCAP